MDKLRLFWIDFETAMCLEQDALYIMKSKELPSKKEAINALIGVLYSGAIYINDIKEVSEADIRYRKVVLIEDTKKETV
ncbi:MAG: hypothetical protein ACMV1K_00170 [Sulfurospirillum sp.]